MPGGPKPKDKTVTTPLRGIPEAPSSLDRAAKDHWNRLTQQIDEAGLLSVLDVDAFTLYISTWSLYRQAMAEIKKSGMVVEAKNTYEMLSLWWKVRESCMRDLKHLLTQFGLTPQARAKMVIAEKEAIDPKWQVPGDE